MLVQIDDRRVFDRFSARFPVKFKGSREDFGSSVFLRDMSAEGAKIALRGHVYVNDEVDLLVELPDGHAPMQISGKVVWARATSPQTWDAGVKLDKVDFMETQRIFHYCL